MKQFCSRPSTLETSATIAQCNKIIKNPGKRLKQKESVNKKSMVVGNATATATAMVKATATATAKATATVMAIATPMTTATVAAMAKATVGKMTRIFSFSL